MPAATPIPKLVAFLAMMTAVALVSHEVSAVSANATEAHKSMSASAMLVSRDTDSDPKYDMHSLRTGDTTRAETAEERAPSFENLRNTVRSWAKGVKMKFRPYKYEQLHSVSMDSAKDGLHPSPSVIESGETDKALLLRTPMYPLNLFGRMMSLVRFDNSKLTKSDLQFLKSLCDKEPFFDIARKDTVFITLNIFKTTAHDHLLNMYIARDNEIAQLFSQWRMEGKESVIKSVKPRYTESDEVAELVQLKYDSYRGNMGKQLTGWLKKRPSIPSQVKWLLKNQPFRDDARTQISRVFEDAELLQAFRKFDESFFNRDYQIQKILSTQEHPDVQKVLISEGVPTIVARLYDLVYKSQKNLLDQQEVEAGDSVLSAFASFNKLDNVVENLEFRLNLDASEKAELKKAVAKRNKQVLDIREKLGKRLGY